MPQGTAGQFDAKRTLNLECGPPRRREGDDAVFATDGDAARKPGPIVPGTGKSLVAENNRDAPLRVAVFSTHDSGGAGIAARRLHEGLRANGCASEMFVAEVHAPVRHMQLLPGAEVLCFDGGPHCADASWLRAANRGQARLRKDYPLRDVAGEITPGAGLGRDIGELPLAEEYDILHLHWVVNFLCLPSAQDILRNKPIVWTLHDMRPFTGGCHYAGGCERFTERCGSCPMLGSRDDADVSFETWRAQMAAYRKRNLHIVAPSRWLADLAAQSSLFRKFPVSVIENGHPLDVFRPLDRDALRAERGLAPDEFVLGFSAENLCNRRKGMRYLVECLERLAATPLRGKIRLLLLGGNPPEEIMRCGLRVEAEGSVSGGEAMAKYYNMLDALAVPSLEDNMPNVIAEAAGCGTPTVAFAAGGIGGMVRHGETGWLAAPADASGLAAGVAALAVDGTASRMREACRRTALSRWEATKQAGLYKDLFTRLGGKKG